MYMPSVKYLALFLACVVVFAAGTNASIIDGGTSYYTTPPPAQTFSDGETSAEIQCNVYTYQSGAYKDKYAYTYRIINNSSADLSFVSMQINNNSVDIVDFNVEATDSGDVIPDIWDLVGTPRDSFNGHFNDTILSGEQSALLWFVSDYAPTNTGRGFIMGVYADPGETAWIPFYAEGDLIIPSQVPEPATFLLISMGTFAIIGRRKRSQEAV